MEQFSNINNDVIDLKEVLTILKRRYKVIVAVILCFLVVSAIYSYFFTVPIYQADTVLMVTKSMPDNLSSGKSEGMESVINSIAKFPEMTMNTYMSQLKGDPIMERVLRKLKLDKAGYSTRSLVRSVAVEGDKENNLIKLTVTHPNPILAAKIANTTTQELLLLLSETNEQRVNKSLELLKKQATSTGEEFNKAVVNLTNLEAQPRGVSMLEKLIEVKTEDLSNYQSLTLQTVMEYQKVLAGKKQAEKQFVDTPPVLEASKFDEKLGKSILVEEVNPAYTELATMINQKTVVASEKEVEMKNLQLITNQLSQELKALHSEIGQKRNLLQLAQNEVKRLEEANSMLRTKTEEANMSLSIIFGEKNLTVVSPATVPSGPVGSNKIKNMLIALGLGLVFSVGLVFLLNYLDHTVKTPKDAEEILGLPVLGQIPSYNLVDLKQYGGA